MIERREAQRRLRVRGGQPFDRPRASSRATSCLRGAALAAALAVSPALAQTIEEKAQLCAGCHGANGVPTDKSWPVISGQQLGYLYLQLRDFKSGARKSEVMGPLAAALDRDEMMAFAGYFSKQPWPDLRQPRAPAAVAAQAVDREHRDRLHRLPSGSDIRARVPSRDLPGRRRTICKARCWRSATRAAATIPA